MTTSQTQAHGRFGEFGGRGGMPGLAVGGLNAFFVERIKLSPVVLAGGGPILVIAGAGSGKTRTLVYRVARLIESGTDPSRIMLLTFTNKAAREMLRRVESLLSVDTRRLMGGTFHSVGSRLLRRTHGGAVPLSLRRQRRGFGLVQARSPLRPVAGAVLAMPAKRVGVKSRRDLVVLLVRLLRQERDGRALIAIRDHYLSAEIMGINLTKYRTLSFGLLM